MLNILLSALCAFSIISNDAPVAGDSTVYIINGTVVEKFDGSQLRNKHISEYIVETKNGISVHTITFTPYSEKHSKNASVIYLNGKKVSVKELKDLKTIGDIKIIKGKAASSSGTDAEKKDVIVIKTKKIVSQGDTTTVTTSAPHNACYILDGEKVPAEVFGLLPTSSIKDITVLRKESEILKHTSDKVDMVIIVNTKK